jgi:hypothetical protein
MLQNAFLNESVRNIYLSSRGIRGVFCQSVDCLFLGKNKSENEVPSVLGILRANLNRLNPLDS